MTATMIQAVPTPVPLNDAILGMTQAWPIAVSAPRTPEAVAVSIAHGSLECGNFGYRNGAPADPPTLYCFNLANQRPGKNYDGLICQYRCNEVIDGKVVWYDPPNPGEPGYGDPDHGSSFRAFQSLHDGCVAYLQFLSGRVRYWQAWKRLCAGDPVGFVVNLKASGYFTGSEEPYRRAVLSIFGKVLPTVRSIIAGEQAQITDGDRDHIMGLVAQTLADQASGIVGAA